jgi:hypothetical protein
MWSACSAISDPPSSPSHVPLWTLRDRSRSAFFRFVARALIQLSVILPLPRDLQVLAFLVPISDLWLVLEEPGKSGPEAKPENPQRPPIGASYLDCGRGPLVKLTRGIRSPPRTGRSRRRFEDIILYQNPAVSGATVAATFPITASRDYSQTDLPLL